MRNISFTCSCTQPSRSSMYRTSFTRSTFTTMTGPGRVGLPATLLHGFAPPPPPPHAFLRKSLFSSCTSFRLELSQLVQVTSFGGGTIHKTQKKLVENFSPLLLVNPDTENCGFEWEANTLKVPYCNGNLASQECSGRGLCDRTNGVCTCFDGYTGEACQEVEALA